MKVSFLTKNFFYLYLSIWLQWGYKISQRLAGELGRGK